MKPVAFAYERPADIEAALVLLTQADDAKLLAGGQTLGPMLNLRLAQPDLVIDITRIEELTRIESTMEQVTLGSLITHAAIEDGRAADATCGLLPKVARGIAYRAVRNRGTLGGSLAHADPAADWLSCFLALDALISIAGPHGERRTPIGDFVRGALDSDLGTDEIVTAIRFPPLSERARWGYAKICRKAGEFAEAIGVYVSDPERGFERLIAGAVGGKPLSLPINSAPEAADLAGMAQLLREAGYSGGAYEIQIHAAALMRAVTQACSR